MPPVFDPQVLQSLEADLGEPGLLSETVEIYLADLPARSATIVDAAARGDLEALRFATHSLASSSALLGALDLHRLCRQLELRDDVQDPTVRDELIGGWDEVCTGTERALRSWLSGQGSNR